MQVSPVSPQPRLIVRIYQLHKRLRRQKQTRRIEEQKQYMQMLRQRKENPDLIKTHRKPIIVLAHRLFIGGYLLFLLAYLLFYFNTNPTKQLLGHQFYHMAQENIQTIIVKRIPFNEYRKGDAFVYRSDSSSPLYQVGDIQNIDVANYRITIKQDNNSLVIPKEQLVGRVIYKAKDVMNLINTTTTILLYTNAVILLIFILQLTTEVKHFIETKRYPS